MADWKYMPAGNIFMVSCLLSCSFSDLMLLGNFVLNLDGEIEVFIALASVKVSPAFWTFRQFLSI